MSPSETRVLEVLAEHYTGDGMCYLPFAPICAEGGLDRSQVRRACRSLARKGLAEYARGLWNEDGEMVGAGYSATLAGYQAWERNQNIGK